MQGKLESKCPHFLMIVPLRNFRTIASFKETMSVFIQGPCLGVEGPDWNSMGSPQMVCHLLHLHLLFKTQIPVHLHGASLREHHTNVIYVRKCMYLCVCLLVCTIVTLIIRTLD